MGSNRAIGTYDKILVKLRLSCQCARAFGLLAQECTWKDFHAVFQTHAISDDDMRMQNTIFPDDCVSDNAKGSN
ncbi:hypothetical protein D3C78_1628480 [compost metagenome]